MPRALSLPRRPTLLAQEPGVAMSADVVLVDSGVNASHPHLRGRQVVPAATISPEGDLVLGVPQVDRLGHGTAAAAAILDLAPAATLHSIQIFHDEAACPFDHVLRAVAWALDRGADLVNLSLGTAELRWLDPLADLVARAAEGGTTLVAPASFRGLPSYPGMLPGVAGVVVDPAIPRDAPELRPDGLRAFWHASPFPRPLPNLPPSLNLSGPSLATANVTGFLAACLRSGRSRLG